MKIEKRIGGRKMGIIQRSLVISIAAALMSAAVLAQATGKRVTDKATGMSISPPTGWKLDKAESDGDMLFIGPIANDMTPNLRVTADSFALPLKDYVDSSIKEVMKPDDEYGPKNTAVVRKSGFITLAGLKGKKVVLASTFLKMPARTTLYVFAGPGEKKFILIFTSSAAAGAKTDKLFNASAATFRVKK